MSRVLAALVLLASCSEPGPVAVARMRSLTEAMCACTDVACRERVEADKKADNPLQILMKDLSREDEKALDALDATYKRCRIGR